MAKPRSSFRPKDALEEESKTRTVDNEKAVQLAQMAENYHGLKVEIERATSSKDKLHDEIVGVVAKRMGSGAASIEVETINGYLIQLQNVARTGLAKDAADKLQSYGGVRLLQKACDLVPSKEKIEELYSAGEITDQQYQDLLDVKVSPRLTVKPA